MSKTLPKRDAKGHFIKTVKKTNTPFVLDTVKSLLPYGTRTREFKGKLLSPVIGYGSWSSYDTTAFVASFATGMNGIIGGKHSPAGSSSGLEAWCYRYATKEECQIAGLPFNGKKVKGPWYFDEAQAAVIAKKYYGNDLPADKLLTDDGFKALKVGDIIITNQDCGIINYRIGEIDRVDGDGMVHINGYYRASNGTMVHCTWNVWQSRSKNIKVHGPADKKPNTDIQTRIKWFKKCVVDGRDVYFTGHRGIEEAFFMGNTYEIPEDKTIKACKAGYHCCTNSLDSVRNWMSSGTVPVNVQMTGDRDREGNKEAFRKMTLVEELGYFQFADFIKGLK